MTLWILTKENELENGVQIANGLNTIRPGLPYHCWLHHTDTQRVFGYIWGSRWIRRVTVPDGATVREYQWGWISDRLMLGKRCDLSDPYVIWALIEAGADPYINDGTMLCWAAEEGYSEIIELLLKTGTDIARVHPHALWWAARNGHTKAVRLLLDAGANVHTRHDASIKDAAEFGHAEVVRLLLEHGADLHGWDDYATRWAIENERVDVVREIIVHQERFDLLWMHGQWVDGLLAKVEIARELGLMR